MKDMRDVVVLTKEEYHNLMESRAFLECLRACGVDNWVGYDDACSMMREEEE